MRVKVLGRLMYYSLRRLAWLMAIIALPGLSSAQDLQTIAAIVNETIISGYDLDQRVNLVINATKLADTEETRTRLRTQALNALVDESLQVQEAERNNITVTEDDLLRAFETVARQNNVPFDNFDAHLQAQGISKVALTEQIKAEIMWSKLVRRKLLPKVSIGEEEIDEMLAQLRASTGKTEYKLQEIFIPVSNPDNEYEILQGVERLLQQLRQGADFVAAARQFSRAATATSGGDVGWVLAENLSAGLGERIANLDVGDITDPVETIGGFTIYRLDNRRKLLTEDPKATTVTLNQLYWTLDSEGSGEVEGTDSAETAYAEAEAAARDIQGCEGLSDLASERGWPEVIDLGSLKLGDLPDNISEAVRDTDVGAATAPLSLEPDLMVLIVCERVAQEVKLPSRGQILDELTRRRMAVLAFRYLRDLRQSAAIEYR